MTRVRPWLPLVVASTFVALDANARDAIEAERAVERCATDAESAQSLREGGHFRLAVDKLVACSQEVCPTVVRGDCARWLDEVRSEQPSVVFAAHDESGSDLPSVRVLLDGAAVPDTMVGRAVAVDPGTHHVRFEAEGHKPVEITFVSPERQKARVVTAVLEARSSAPAPRSGTSPLVYATAGIGVVALAGWTYFGISGLDAHASLAATCAPTQRCSTSDVDSARTRLLVADVAAVVTVIAGVALVIELLSQRSPARAASTSAPAFAASAAGGLQ